MSSRAAKMEAFFGRILIMFFLLAPITFWGKNLILGPKTTLAEESRSGTQLPSFTIKRFLSNKYQDELELAISDQMPLSEKIRDFSFQVKNQTFRHLSWISINPTTKYRLVAHETFTYDATDWLLDGVPTDEILTTTPPKAQKIADFYNQLPIKNKYLYVIPKDYTVNFDHPSDELFSKLKDWYQGFTVSQLEVKSFADYQKYFLKNDHHWNYVGSYRGYKDIIKMIFGEDEEIRQPLEKVTFGYLNKGSRNRNAKFYDYPEHFTAYHFDFGDYDTYVDHAKKSYGHQEQYFAKQNRESLSGYITYEDFYGENNALVEFNYRQPERGNLLVVGFSDTNALNNLIASHFNRTYIVDPRHMKKSEFMYIVDNCDIDTLLLLPNMLKITEDALMLEENV